MEVTKTWTERFNAKWQLDEQSGCWVWMAALYTNGYGQIKVPGTRRQMPAHRLSYLILCGEIPNGMCVLHRCDNKRCVNPKHLFLGTKHDNAQDMVSKGRHCFGEKQGASKLKEKDVKRMLEMVRAGVSQALVADTFGLSPIHVSRIVRGQRWGHLQPGKPKWRKRRKFITAEQAQEIRAMALSGKSQYVIAQTVGVSQAHVCRLLAGKVARFK